MKPDIIDWRITASCNQSCAYCYATDYKNGAMSCNVADDEKIIKKITEIGCDTVCISGGEPLIDDNGNRAYQIIKKLKDNGLNIFLSTNGTNYMELEKRYNIGSLLSKLSMPLDGYDKESSKINGRGEDSFECVKDILDKFQISYNNGERIPTIKVSTVITKKNIQNYDYWAKLCKFICDYKGVIKLWKIYDFIPENRGKNNKEDLAYSIDEFKKFEKIVEDMRDEQRDIPIEIVSRNSRSLIYFIICPNGNVIIPEDNGDETIEQVLGNILNDNINQIICSWSTKIKQCRSKIYSKGRNINIKRSVYEDDVSRKLLTMIADKARTGELYSREEIINAIANESMENIDSVSRKLDSLLQGTSPVIKEIIPLIKLSHIGFNDFLVNLEILSSSNEYQLDDIVETIICRNTAVGWCAHYKQVNVQDNACKENHILRLSVFASNVDNCRRHIDEIVNQLEQFQLIVKVQDIANVSEQYVAYDRMVKQRDYVLDGRELNNVNDEHKNLHITESEKKVLKAMSTFCGTNNLCLETLVKYLTSRENEKRFIAMRDDRIKRELKNDIDSLRDKELISAFQLVINPSKLGLHSFLVFYKLAINKGNYQQIKDEVKEYLKDIKEVSHFNIMAIGRWNVDVEIQVQTCGGFANIDALIENKFSTQIEERQYLELVKEYKFTFLIPVVVKAIENRT